MKRILLLCVGGLLTVACPDAAKDKPQAKVEDVKATPPEPDTPAPPENRLKMDVPDGALTFDATSSSIGFVGQNVRSTHAGGFKDFTGFVLPADGKIEGGKVKVVIDMWSLWADNPKLQNHLKDKDFFLVSAHPMASFESTAVVPAPGGEGTYDVTGQLELRGVTASVTFPAQITLGEAGATATAEFALKRRMFGVNYDGAADNLVRDDVVVKLDVKASKK